MRGVVLEPANRMSLAIAAARRGFSKLAADDRQSKGARRVRGERVRMPSENQDAAGIPAEVFQANTNLGPWRRKRKALRPFEYDDGWLREQILHAESFKIVKVFDAIEIAVKHWLGVTISISMKQCEGQAGHVFFACGAERAYDTLSQRSLAAAEVAGKKDQHG